MPTGNGTTNRHAGNLLVVEPEALLRWSLVTYLGQWFEVLSAETKPAADRILDEHKVDAVVVSDELSDSTMQALEAHARSRNAATRVIRTVTTERAWPTLPKETRCIEKPFELAKLAELLGVR